MAPRDRSTTVPTPESTETTAVARPEERKSNLPTARYDAADYGAGFEDMTRDDYQIPFYGILQKMSPQVDPDKSVYIDGAKAGQIINNVTLERFDGREGILYIPVHRTHRFVEWVPRDQAGGGFVGQHMPDSDVVKAAQKAAGKQFGKLELENGNDLVETFYVFGIHVKPDDSVVQSVIAFASTQIGAYKRWMTTASMIQVRNESDGRMVTPPMFAHVYRLRTQLQENKKGSWHGWLIGFRGEDAAASRLGPEDSLYLQAKAFRNLAMEERVQVNYDTAGRGDDEQPKDQDDKF